MPTVPERPCWHKTVVKTRPPTPGFSAEERVLSVFRRHCSTVCALQRSVYSPAFSFKKDIGEIAYTYRPPKVKLKKPPVGEGRRSGRPTPTPARPVTPHVRTWRAGGVGPRGGGGGDTERRRGFICRFIAERLRISKRGSPAHDTRQRDPRISGEHAKRSQTQKACRPRPR